jgi:neutral ceramidase
MSLMRSIISWASQPTEQQIECQQPKPIVMNMGGDYFPFAPRVLPIQLLRIGQVIIVGVPTEVTTMAGRRLEAHLKKVFCKLNPIVIISSMSNCYASYTTTYEEYVYQRYEGASTLYGPFQLS